MVNSKITKILQELTKAIVSDVKSEVKKEMRDFVWLELREVIKDVLKKEEITIGSSTGFLSMEMVKQ